jgi:hypothetical protein
VLFSVLMSIGMVGAVSWGMLQAQASNAALGSALPVKSPQPVALAQTQSNADAANKNLRMSYQLNIVEKTADNGAEK